MNKEYIAKKIILILLLMLLILLFFFYCIAPNLFSRLSHSRLKSVEVQIERLIVSLEVFKLDIGRYPTSKEGLEALIICPSTINRNIWKGSYLERKKFPIDPWGNNFNYKYDTANKTILLYSYGRDGISKSEGNDLDDVNNWDKKRKWEKYYLGSKLPEKIVCWILVVFIILNIYMLLKLEKVKDIK